MLMRFVCCLVLFFGLAGCGEEKLEGGWVKISNAVNHPMEGILWHVFFLSHDAAKNEISEPNLQPGETGHVELDAGLTVWGEPHRIIFDLLGVEFGTGEEFAIERGQTIHVVFDDAIQIFECKVDTDPACLPK